MTAIDPITQLRRATYVRGKQIRPLTERIAARIEITPTGGQVNEIRSSTEKQAVLADRYGVAQSRISLIRNNKSWAASA